MYMLSDETNFNNFSFMFIFSGIVCCLITSKSISKNPLRLLVLTLYIFLFHTATIYCIN
jgi:hypothetical protein